MIRTAKKLGRLFRMARILARHDAPASVGPTVLRTSVADERDKIDLTLAYIYVPAGSTLTITIGC